MRRTGRTTRIIDQAVQLLFEKGSLNLGGVNPDIVDHVVEEGVGTSTEKQMQEYLFKRVTGRLISEHAHLYTEMNPRTLTIKIKKS